MSLEPSNLGILTFPDPALRRRGVSVEEITDEVRAVAARMIELMGEVEGIGLAAPQVGLAWRLFVAHVPPSPEAGRMLDTDPMTALIEPEIYINPELRDFQGDLESHEEGCLSLPDINGDIRRHPQVTIEATDLEGNRFTRCGAGLLARCWQHEYDHLDGVLIIDRMTPMSRLKNRSKLRDLEKQAAAL